MRGISRLRTFLAEKNLDGAIVTTAENRRYLSGFTGSNGYLLVTASDLVLVTDQRYSEQAALEAPDFRIVTHGLDPFPFIESAIGELGIGSLGYDAKGITDYEASRLRAELPSVRLVAMEDVVRGFRAVKDAEERAFTLKSLEIAEGAMRGVASLAAPGMTERDLAAELEYMLAKAGSEAPTFGTIVATGKRSSLPHASPTDRKIEDGDMVVVDFGARFGGYMSDITRTIWVGEPSPRMAEIFRIVETALCDAIKAIRPGATCGEVDRAHREVFLAAGLEDRALRGLGHGVGLAIHEAPRVVIGSDEVLEEGMIFTVEPGLYLPDLGGVRIEDMVIVTRDGCEVLNRCPRTLRAGGQRSQ